jgi:hypothetical protein
VLDFLDIGLGIDQILAEDLEPPDLFTDKTFHHLRIVKAICPQSPLYQCPVAGCLGLDCSRPLCYR